MSAYRERASAFMAAAYAARRAAKALEITGRGPGCTWCAQDQAKAIASWCERKAREARRLDRIQASLNPGGRA